MKRMCRLLPVYQLVSVPPCDLNMMLDGLTSLPLEHIADSDPKHLSLN